MPDVFADVISGLDSPTLEDLVMVAGSDDREVVYQRINLTRLAELLLPWQQVKDAEYRSHWSKRGLLGFYYGCISRQTDRLDPGFMGLFKKFPKFDVSGSSPIIYEDEISVRLVLSLLDTLVDTAIYSLMGICLLCSKFPVAGERFVNSLEDKVKHGI